MNIQKPDAVLVVAREQCLLSSTLVEIFKRKSGSTNAHHVPTLEQAEKIAADFELMVVFSDFPLGNLTARLRKLLGTKLKILLVLREGSKHSFRYFKELAFDGFISETSNYEELCAAIHAIVVKNRRYICQELINLSAGVTNVDAFVVLSRKELEIAELVLAGRKNKEIAGKLKISEKTVSTHKARIFRKLDVTSEIDLLKLSQEYSIR